MLFPQCRAVGVNPGFLKGGRPVTDVIHSATEYMLVFSAPDRCEVYQVNSSGNGGLLNKITSVERIATADQTIVCQGQVDLFNRPELVGKAHSLCKGPVNTIVYQGFDQHYTFVQDPDPGELTVVNVYDMAPPEPPKLVHNLRRLEALGMFGDLMLAFEYHIIDLRHYEDPAKTTIFPCSVAGLKGEFMNCLQAEPRGDVKLVGCDTTKAAFSARFPGKQFEFVSLCPLGETRPPRPFIFRCDRPGRAGPAEIGGVPGTIISFAANPPEIYEAVRQLSATLKNGRKSP